MMKILPVQVFMFLLFCLLVESAPVEESVQLGKTLKQTGCFYMNNKYDHGERIDTSEPCLNCTCLNSMLMCYLRICPFVKPLSEDCIVERHEEDCCPKIWCPEVIKEENKPPYPDEEKVKQPGCYVKDQFFSDGAQLPPNAKEPCEVCYCIRNSTACIMQECELKIEGCYPVHKDGQCCPSRYNCSYEEAVPTPPGVTFEEFSEGCTLTDGRFVADGEAVKSTNPCEHCYCMRNEVVCAIQECQAPSDNCKPLPQKLDQCCPEKYECSEESTSVEGSSVTQQSTVSFSFVSNSNESLAANVHVSTDHEDVERDKNGSNDEEISSTKNQYFTTSIEEELTTKPIMTTNEHSDLILSTIKFANKLDFDTGSSLTKPHFASLEKINNLSGSEKTTDYSSLPSVLLDETKTTSETSTIVEHKDLAEVYEDLEFESINMSSFSTPQDEEDLKMSSISTTSSYVVDVESTENLKTISHSENSAIVPFHEDKKEAHHTSIADVNTSVKSASKTVFSKTSQGNKIFKAKDITTPKPLYFSKMSSPSDIRENVTVTSNNKNGSSSYSQPLSEGPVIEIPIPSAEASRKGFKGEIKYSPLNKFTQETYTIKPQVLQNITETYFNNDSRSNNSTKPLYFDEIESILHSLENNTVKLVKIKGKKPTLSATADRVFGETNKGIATEQHIALNKSIENANKEAHFHIKGKLPPRPIFPFATIPGKKEDNRLNAGTKFRPSIKGRPFFKPIPGEDTCRINGLVYLHGQSVESSDVCKKRCQCFKGKIFCMEINCQKLPDAYNKSGCISVKHRNQCCPYYNCGTEMKRPIEFINISEISYLDGMFANTATTNLPHDASQTDGVPSMSEEALFLEVATTPMEDNGDYDINQNEGVEESHSQTVMSRFTSNSDEQFETQPITPIARLSTTNDASEEIESVPSDNNEDLSNDKVFLSTERDDVEIQSTSEENVPPRATTNYNGLGNVIDKDLDETLKTNLPLEIYTSGNETNVKSETKVQEVTFITKETEAILMTTKLTDGLKTVTKSPEITSTANSLEIKLTEESPEVTTSKKVEEITYPAKKVTFSIEEEKLTSPTIEEFSSPPNKEETSPKIDDLTSPTNAEKEIYTFKIEEIPTKIEDIAFTTKREQIDSTTRVEEIISPEKVKEATQLIGEVTSPTKIEEKAYTDKGFKIKSSSEAPTTIPTFKGSELSVTSKLEEVTTNAADTTNVHFTGSAEMSNDLDKFSSEKTESLAFDMTTNKNTQEEFKFAKPGPTLSELQTDTFGDVSSTTTVHPQTLVSTTTLDKEQLIEEKNSSNTLNLSTFFEETVHKEKLFTNTTSLNSLSIVSTLTNDYAEDLEKTPTVPENQDPPTTLSKETTNFAVTGENAKNQNSFSTTIIETSSSFSELPSSNLEVTTEDSETESLSTFYFDQKSSTSNDGFPELDTTTHTTETTPLPNEDTKFISTDKTTLEKDLNTESTKKVNVQTTSSELDSKLSEKPVFFSTENPKIETIPSQEVSEPSDDSFVISTESVIDENLNNQANNSFKSDSLVIVRDESFVSQKPFITSSTEPDGTSVFSTDEPITISEVVELSTSPHIHSGLDTSGKTDDRTEPEKKWNETKDLIIDELSTEQNSEIPDATHLQGESSATTLAFLVEEQVSDSGRDSLPKDASQTVSQETVPAIGDENDYSSSEVLHKKKENADAPQKTFGETTEFDENETFAPILMNETPVIMESNNEIPNISNMLEAQTIKPSKTSNYISDWVSESYDEVSHLPTHKITTSTISESYEEFKKLKNNDGTKSEIDDQRDGEKQTTYADFKIAAHSVDSSLQTANYETRKVSSSITDSLSTVNEQSSSFSTNDLPKYSEQKKETIYFPSTFSVSSSLFTLEQNKGEVNSDIVTTESADIYFDKTNDEHQMTNFVEQSEMIETSFEESSRHPDKTKSVPSLSPTNFVIQDTHEDSDQRLNHRFTSIHLSNDLSSSENNKKTTFDVSNNATHLLLKESKPPIISPDFETDEKITTKSLEYKTSSDDSFTQNQDSYGNEKIYQPSTNLQETTSSPKIEDELESDSKMEMLPENLSKIGSTPIDLSITTTVRYLIDEETSLSNTESAENTSDINLPDTYSITTKGDDEPYMNFTFSDLEKDTSKESFKRPLEQQPSLNETNTAHHLSTSITDSSTTFDNAGLEDQTLKSNISLPIKDDTYFSSEYSYLSSIQTNEKLFTTPNYGTPVSELNTFSQAEGHTSLGSTLLNKFASKIETQAVTTVLPLNTPIANLKNTSYSTVELETTDKTIMGNFGDEEVEESKEHILTSMDLLSLTTNNDNLMKGQTGVITTEINTKHEEVGDKNLIDTSQRENITQLNSEINPVITNSETTNPSMTATEDITQQNEEKSVPKLLEAVMNFDETSSTNGIPKEDDLPTSWSSIPTFKPFPTNILFEETSTKPSRLNEQAENSAKYEIANSFILKNRTIDDLKTNPNASKDESDELFTLQTTQFNSEAVAENESYSTTNTEGNLSHQLTSSDQELKKQLLTNDYTKQNIETVNPLPNKENTFDNPMDIINQVLPIFESISNKTIAANSSLLPYSNVTKAVTESFNTSKEVSKFIEEASSSPDETKILHSFNTTAAVPNTSYQEYASTVASNFIDMKFDNKQKTSNLAQTVTEASSEKETIQVTTTTAIYNLSDINSLTNDLNGIASIVDGSKTTTIADELSEENKFFKITTLPETNYMTSTRKTTTFAPDEDGTTTKSLLHITELHKDLMENIADYFPHSSPSILILGTHSPTPSLVSQTLNDKTSEESSPSDSDGGYCLFENVLYNSVEPIPRKDPCEFCFCFRGDIICLQQTCPPPVRGCFATPIKGFCCPRFQCPVQEMHFNVSTTTTTTTNPRMRKWLVGEDEQTTGCEIEGKVYRVHEVVRPASGPCMLCRCELGGMMKCDPRECHPEAPLLLRWSEEFLKKRK